MMTGPALALAEAATEVELDGAALAKADSDADAEGATDVLGVGAGFSKGFPAIAALIAAPCGMSVGSTSSFDAVVVGAAGATVGVTTGGGGGSGSSRFPHANGLRSGAASRAGRRSLRSMG
jgi:hypothetical protein